MKILLTGGTGQVGWELQRTLMTLGEVIPVGRNVTHASLQMDLAQPDTIIRVVREVRPDLIVNPAAYTNVDKAESEPELAMMVNGIAPGIMAEEAKRLGIAIVYYSTDYVFDGMSQVPYIESDSTNPQNVYGQTKLAGEKAIQAIEVPHLIFRTSWVYGMRGKNFLLTMLKLGQEREELSVVDDQIGAPTWSRAIAEVTAQVLTQGLVNLPEFLQDKGGLYHLSARGKTSWYGFAQKIFVHHNDVSVRRSRVAVRRSRVAVRRLQRLIPITSDKYPTAAKRPNYSLLDGRKLTENFGLVLPEWNISLSLAMARN
ncbi:MAG: dTDP-4-dehydrorhamnose reductase [Cyanobacteria bacterium J06639_18]